MRTRRFLVLAVLGLLVGFGARRLWPAPTPVARMVVTRDKAAARPSTPESRRLAARLVAARPAPTPAPRREPAMKLELHPRAPEEWQGMRVLTAQPGCETSATCGLGLACVGTRCGPCKNDGQCLSGERCAMDHCVPAAGVTCHSMHDCAGGELCVLSGYSADPRGNTGMKSTCLASTGGSDAVEDAPAPAGPERTDFGDFTPPQDLLDSL